MKKRVRGASPLCHHKRRDRGTYKSPKRRWRIIRDVDHFRGVKAARMRLINRVVDRIDAARMDKIPVTNGTIGRVWFLEDVRAILEDVL